MAKRKLFIGNYTFDVSTKKITIPENISAERLLLITDVTLNKIIYNFADPNFGFDSVTFNETTERTEIVLKINLSTLGASNSDKLQIYVDQDYQEVEFSDTFVDPVSKIRVSQPENLIDTDFEYGLQSTKWETLELVKNIPTFFSRNGDTSLTLTSISTISGSDIVTVELSDIHNFLAGTPVIISGSKNITCDGAFVVTNVLSTTSFQYKAKAIQNYTGSILGDYTVAYSGQVYQGTEFDITGIDAITTDALQNSLLTVKTAYPTDFTEGTSFFLTNSVGTINTFTDATQTIPDNHQTIISNVTNNVATGETGFTLGSVSPYSYSGSEEVAYFRNNQITVDATADTITFSSPHGLLDNKTYLYVVGDGNTAIGGLSDYTGYYVRVLSDTVIYLTATQGGTTRVQLTVTGTDGGVTRSAFIRGYRAISTNTSAAFETIIFNEAHGLTSLSSQLLLFFNGTSSNLSTSTNLITSLTGYYPHTVMTSDSLSFTSTPGGAKIGLVTTTANSVMIKASLLPSRFTLYYENNGIADNSVVTFTTVSGIAPNGLTSTGEYKVEKVGANRIRFKDVSTDAIINITNIGTTNGQYRVTNKNSVYNNDSIYAPNNSLTDGSPVLYQNSGNTSIGGLTNNSTYYVFQKTNDRFKLSTTAAGWISTAKTLTQNTSTVFVTGDTFSLASHGFTTGNAIQYTSATPIGGLTNGAFYWVRSINTSAFSLHWTKNGAITNTDYVLLASPISGTGSFREAALVDITSTSTGTHLLSSSAPNITDGVYTLTDIVDDNTFKIQSTSQIPDRILPVDPFTSIDLSRSSIKYTNHYLTTGAEVTYNTSGTPIGGLTISTNYYVIRVSKNWFRLADTFQNAIDGIALTLTSVGSGTHQFTTSSISGEVVGNGTISISADSKTVVGTDTNFSAIFARGDKFIMFQPDVTSSKIITTINTTTDELTASADHGLSNGNPVIMSASVAPTGTTNNYIYYVRVISTTVVTLHPTYTDAINNTSKIDLTTTGTSVTLQYLSSIGSTTEGIISRVLSTADITLNENVTQTFTNASYAIGTALYLRADGFALHRPYDGGVELIPSSNPDSMMTRQTRKYFRYQSGKGIQVSFAVNFSPSTLIDNMQHNNGVATITTKNPHRLTAGLPITIFGATVSSGTNYWNGSFTIDNVIDSYNFVINLNGSPVDPVASGIIEYYVNGWSNSLLKCGLFDDQNGLYFEYNGSTLHCVRRSSTLQLSGTASVTFKSGEIVGNGTKFSSQLSKGDKIVVKGQSYLISKIVNDTLLYILPSYRGVSSTNVIITKTVDTKIPQSEWNIDPCDGNGQTGYKLDIHRIQMAYMDYSWYGAGKARFGFKDQHGKVKYVHEFLHNNRFREAYMRSGNIPARYEIENVGTPTYVPALAHWGTSVIMDGRFDDDKAYVFNASSNTLSVTGAATVSITGKIETLTRYQVLVNNTQWRDANYAIRITTPSATFNTIPTNVSVSGAGLSAGTRTSLPLSTQILPRQSYLPSATSRYSTLTQDVRNLLFLDRPPTATSGTDSTYTVTLSSATTAVVYEQPLISVRLAPSVDNGTPGSLGQREIINRMQLILNSVGVLTTHSVEVSLKLNGSLNNYEWQRVTNPSLSQLIYHSTNDRISGGTTIYTFRGQGGTGTTARTQVNNVVDLSEIATLGNSIMGGDGIFPDGPDVLTLVVKLIEDPSSVSASNPLTVAGRLSWSESQA